jgi:hypothetical protein
MDEEINQEEQIGLETERAMLGHEVDEFFHTPMGRYMRNRAQDEFELAAIQLARVSPADIAEVSRLQVRILATRLVINWLSDAITDGLQAVKLLEARRNHEN